MKAKKNSFIVYYDLESQTELLSDEQLGKLLRALFIYEIHGKEPIFDDDIVKASFQFIKVTLDINREKYDEKCKRNAENGKKGGRPKKESKNGNTVNTSFNSCNLHRVPIKRTKRRKIDIKQINIKCK